MRAAWEWVKRHWELLSTTLLVGLGFLLGVSLRKRPVALPAKDPDQKKAEDAAAEEAQEIQAQAAEDKKKLQREHADSLEAVVQEQREQAPVLVKDTDATNEYLKQVGDLVRGNDNGRSN